jgi:hypothetical protein
MKMGIRAMALKTSESDDEGNDNEDFLDVFIFRVFVYQIP